MAESGAETSTGRFLAVTIVIVIAAGVLGAQSLDAPGLYYDEAVQARPAHEFVTGVVYGTPFPGSRSVSISGRPFPWMTQPYMGALKSQALIPTVWAFESSIRALRATTLLWALLGVVLIAVFARRAFGDRVAVIATLLLAFDPSLLLLARHDWGSFAMSLLLRGAALASLYRFWESKRVGFLLAGCVAAGLGLYNKVDFGIFLLAGGVAALACAARQILERIREAPRLLFIAAAGVFAGILPMLPSLASVFAARSAFQQEGEAAEKWRTLWTMLDGSYFHRLMEVGGLFDEMQRANAYQPALFGYAFALAIVAAGVLVLRSREETSRDERAGGLFLLIASLIAVLAYLALPGGVRIHHALNILPFPQLLVAWVLGQIAARSAVARTTALALTTFIVIAGALTHQKTVAFSAENGGRGRWSDSLDTFASELGNDEGIVVVSLDWGFHESLGFLTRGPRLIDAYPRIPAAVMQQGAWAISGGPGHVYLLHETPYDLFGYGAPFLQAAARVDSEWVTVRRHEDGDGAQAFVSVRFERPHQIVFSPRGFEIKIP